MIINVFKAAQEIERMTGELDAANKELVALRAENEQLKNQTDKSAIEAQLKSIESANAELSEKNVNLEKSVSEKDAEISRLKEASTDFQNKVDAAVSAKLLVQTQNLGAAPVSQKHSEKTEKVTPFQRVRNSFKEQINKPNK
jgi:predicted nuclease with TOPRIM domain